MSLLAVKLQILAGFVALLNIRSEGLQCMFKCSIFSLRSEKYSVAHVQLVHVRLAHLENFGGGRKH